MSAWNLDPTYPTTLHISIFLFAFVLYLSDFFSYFLSTFTLFFVICVLLLLLAFLAEVWIGEETYQMVECNLK